MPFLLSKERHESVLFFFASFNKQRRMGFLDLGGNQSKRRKSMNSKMLCMQLETTAIYFRIVSSQKIKE